MDTLFAPEITATYSETAFNDSLTFSDHISHVVKRAVIRSNLMCNVVRVSKPNPQDLVGSWGK